MSSIESTRNEVLRKIGRNVVLFQQLEGLMKALAASQRISAPISRIMTAREESREAVENHTMGQLVGKLMQDLYAPDAEDETDVSEPITEAIISFAFRIETDAAFVESRSKALSELVAARNELIHKILPSWKADSMEGCLNLERYLDEQAVPVRAEIAHFQHLLKTIHEYGVEAKKFIDSEAGQKAFELAWLQQSRIVLMLGDIARQKARADGWTYLSTAGQILKQHAPEEFAAIGTRYAKRNLLDLVMAAELFDVQKEASPGGGNRIIYRVAPGWVLQSGA